MKKFIRLMSALLTAIMLLSGLTGLSMINVSAAEEELDAEQIEDTLSKYLTTVYETPEAKLNTMLLYLEKDGYQLWGDELSGEIAVVDLASGQIMFSNPYDIGTTTGSTDTKIQLMSQIAVRYVDNGAQKTFYSFEEAGYRGQIKMKNIKGGLRVEYTIGREETRMLVPRQISKERMEKVIYSVIEEQLGADNFTFRKLKAYYLLKDPDAVDSDRALAEMQAQFPITKRMAVYVFDPTAKENELRKVEETIKTYCPSYTYEELDRDHEMTDYEGSDRAPALFKMALEYTLDTNGLSVRLPANGIRFDESIYSLDSISILPWMGAGANYAGEDKKAIQTGYTMFPDGSGSIFRFEEVGSGVLNISGKVYGADYAYHTITGQHQEVIRYPAFGLVSNEILSEEVTDPETGLILNNPVNVDRGYLAIIEEGDAMAEISTYHHGTLSKYNAVQMTFYPRPKDSYNMKDAISVGANSAVSVVSKRKYVGNYKIRYFMLTDEEIAEKNKIEKWYEPTWIGMAVAMREYFDAKGILERLSAEDVNKDIPLYIETFGTIETIEKIMSIPVSTMVPLTSFEDIKTMADDLSEEEINNIHFKMTGYANGGMYSSVPYKLKWEKAAGGADGFEELLAYAEEKGFEVYPDFDFVYANGMREGAFDGLNFKKHAIKTVDNRYTSRREYSATYQTFVSYFDMAISPAYFSHFYEKLTENYLKSGATNISVSTLGSDLNSDFDEDEPYNREDSKKFTKEAFAYLDENYENVMTSGGNSYVWQYVDHILNVSLDSSRYNKSSNSIPFLGTVLHGYVQFSGSPLNMEGNIQYALLRTIENGAAPYFILSYQNTTLLKDDAYLSKYYSIRYDIWYDELVSVYNELNGLLADVQTKLIIDHEFLIGERVPDEDELEADIREAMEELSETLSAAEKEVAVQAVKNVLDARLTAKKNAIQIAEYLESVKQYVKDAEASITKIANTLGAYSVKMAEIKAAEAELENLMNAYTKASEVKAAATTAYANDKNNDALKTAYNEAIAAETAAKNAYNDHKKSIENMKKDSAVEQTAYLDAVKGGVDAANSAVAAAEDAKVLAEAAKVAAEFVSKVDGATAEIKASAKTYAEQAVANAAEIAELAEKTVVNASVAIAINGEAELTTLITRIEGEKNAADIRADGVVNTRYNAVNTKIEELATAKAAEEVAYKAYEDARKAYDDATKKAALSTATQEDRIAASLASSAMNEAREAHYLAAKAVEKAQFYYENEYKGLVQALTTVLNTKNNVIEYVAQVEAELAEIATAVANVATLSNLSDELKAAVEEASATAKELTADINSYVDYVSKVYADTAEVVKEYVVLDESAVEDETTTDTEVEEIVEDGYAYTKYTNDNGNIVKVTYGESDSTGKYVAYKTFILNYNFFDVTVVLDGVTYTIPETGYVVFYH